MIPLLVLPNIALVTTFALVGIYQVVMARPSIINFDRIVRKRTPATALDCVLYGVGNLLLAAGLGVFWAPQISQMVFIGGVPQSMFWAAVVYFWPAAMMGIFFAGWANIALRIKYTSLDRRVKSS